MSNQTHHSRTDPDATLARKDRTPLQLKYKVHQTIDAASRVILDTHVTTGAVHDSQPYLEQLQRVERHKIRVRQAVADRGYGSAAIIRYLQQQGIETYIPLWSGRVGNSKYLSGDLVYEKENDRFRCPQGKYLTPNPAISENHKRYTGAANAVRDFVLQTFDVIETGDLCAIASTFTFGREDLLPEVFRQIVDHLSASPSCDLNYFRYYLQRHIDLDGEQHGPMAESLVKHLCEGNETKWRAAEDAPLRALESRLRLWDSVQGSLAAHSKPC